MKPTPLGKLADIKTGKLDVNAGAEDGAYPFFTCATTPYKINQYAFDNEAVLIAGNGDLNVKYYKGKFNAYQRTYVIQNKDKDILFMKYLYYFMETYMDRLRRDAIGGIIKYIKLGHLTNAEIPLPSLDDQKRIGHLLGKVEGLIARRKQHLQQLDDLLKSVFLEMFGDPVRNEKGWDEREIGESIKIKHGFAFKSEFFCDEGQYILLTPGNFFEAGGFRDRGDRQKYYTGETPEEYILNEGSLLLAMTEQAPGLLGSPLIVPESNLYLHNQRLGLAIPKEPTQTRFLFHLFNQKSIRQIIHSKATGTKVRHTSPTKLESIVVGYPPIDLQNQFAAIVRKVETLKARYQQSLADLESLYGALSQKAFKSELDLSRVVVTIDEEEPEEIMEPITPDLTETQPVIELPAPESVGSFFSAKGREALISQWLEVYLERLGSMPFSAQHFMETAQQRLGELLEELEEPESLATDYEFFRFGPNEYDHVKELIFQALESGRLTQAYDEAGNRVQITMAKG